MVEWFLWSRLLGEPKRLCLLIYSFFKKNPVGML